MPSKACRNADQTGVESLKELSAGAYAGKNPSAKPDTQAKTPIAQASATRAQTPGKARPVEDLIVPFGERHQTPATSALASKDFRHLRHHVEVLCHPFSGPPQPFFKVDLRLEAEQSLRLVHAWNSKIDVSRQSVLENNLRL